MGMTEERAAQVAAGDPTFIPGGRGQGRRRAQPGTRKQVGMGELEVIPPEPGWKWRVSDPAQRFDEKQAQAVAREFTRGLVGPEEWQKVIETAIKGAKVGDDKARTFLADYLLGKPGERIELEVGKDLASLMRESMEKDG